MLRSFYECRKEAKFCLVILLLFPFFLYPNVCHSEQLARISKSPISSKIHQPTITAIHTDQRGYLWIGTQHGLYKLDGTRLTVYSSEQLDSNWIPVSDIRGIVDDVDKGILIATFGGGLLKWDQLSQSFNKTIEIGQLDPKYITHLVSSNREKVWVGAREGVFLYDQSNTNNNDWLEREVLRNKIVRIDAMANDNAGNVFVAAGPNLYKISPQERSVKKIAWIDDSLKTSFSISAITIDDMDQVFIGTDGGEIYLINTQDYSIKSKAIIKDGSYVSVSRLLVQGNKLWIGTSNGLYQSDKQLSIKSVFLHSNSDLSSNYITSLVQGERFIWIGTYQGLDTLSIVPFQQFDEQNSNIFDDVLAFTEDSQNRLWVGTYNGLFLLDQSSGKHSNFNDWSSASSIKDQRVMTLASAGDEIWLGFQKSGVQVISTETGRISSPPIPRNDNLEVTKILHDKDGDTWVASYNRGLFQIGDHGVTSFMDNGILPEPSITILFEPSPGELLASSEHKIYQYNASLGKFQYLDFAFQNTSHRPLILSISQGRNGDIWIGTKDLGLFVWSSSDQDKGLLQLTQVDPGGETSLFAIYGIQFDDQGNAWCSTQQGIIKLSGDGQFLAHYTAADGLQGEDFNFGASFTDSQGRIYFGGSNGYNKFDPRQVSIEDSPPRLLITSIDISREDGVHSYDATSLQRLELNHKDYNIKFNFSVLDFLDPEKNLYRYKLEGFNRDWIDNGTLNAANFTNLPPGEYVLRFQGANSAGTWNRDGLSLSVSMAPPPWLTWWAYCSYVLTGLLMFLLVARAFYSYAVERRANQLLVEKQEEAERADDEMQEQLEIQDKLIRSVYRHNVGTLGLVKDFISAQSAFIDNDEAREAAQKNARRVGALTLLEDCLFHQGESLLADLHKYTDMLIDTLLEKSPVDPESIATINEVTTRLLPIKCASALAIVLFELLENSMQHAFEASSPANYIHVTLTLSHSPEQNTDRGQLTVQDNGQGIPETVDPRLADGSGLAIVTAMAEQLAGTLKFRTDRGTLVSLSFPLPPSV